MTTDYRATVFLPKTEFGMRARLPRREPEILERWRRDNLFARLREAAKGREKFILHDGPPYANGHLHIGHALNKILKDVINRSQQMLGRDANYVPGWDCHGLPIEWTIEEKYRADGRDKDEVPLIEFRRECREFAAHWIEVQREEFERLGVLGDWENPYTTMSYDAEAQIVRELGKFLMNGGLYLGAKPVLWSVVEKTALAEAEVEYLDHESTTVHVRFPVVRASHRALAGASALIWTTTPWTIPGNRAIAFGEDIDYAVYEVTETAGDSLAVPGEKVLLARSLSAGVFGETGVAGARKIADLAGSDLAGTVCRHPLDGRGYDFDVPLLPGGHVTVEQGTGLVHTAPGHGSEDFEVGQAHGLEIPRTIGDDGVFYDHVPLFAGQHVYKVDGAVADAIARAGKLMARGRLVHSYPHSWRSKKPLIFRNTPQWFIGMAENELRRKALDAIARTAFYPESGRNRLAGMIAARPDWCVSRQRAWGVPITVFVDRKTGQPLRDEAVLERVVAAVAEEGADAWFESPPERFLAPDHDPSDYEQVTDILDVWFDSGATHSFTLETRADLAWPARSISKARTSIAAGSIPRCSKPAARGAPRPTRACSPTASCSTSRAARCRNRSATWSPRRRSSPSSAPTSCGSGWWASDYSADLRIGAHIIDQNVEAYRRIRNTLRYMLGNLADFDEAERVPPEAMPELERWVLHRLHGRDREVRAGFGEFDFHPLFAALHNFCAVELSAFYFDIRKDALYCGRRDDPVRRAARAVLDALFSCLTAWLAPILCFTAEEAWLNRFGADADSVHLRLFPEIPESWRADEIAGRWRTVRDVRRVVTGALERERAEKRIGSSLQAHPEIFVDPATAAALEGISFDEIAITSDATIAAGPVPPGAFRPARDSRRRRRRAPRRRPEMRALLEGSAGGRDAARPSRHLPALRRRGGPVRRRRRVDPVANPRLPTGLAIAAAVALADQAHQVDRGGLARGVGTGRAGDRVLRFRPGPQPRRELRHVPDRFAVGAVASRGFHPCRDRRHAGLDDTHEGTRAHRRARADNRRRRGQRGRPDRPWPRDRFSRRPRRRVPLAGLQPRR